MMRFKDNINENPEILKKTSLSGGYFTKTNLSKNLFLKLKIPSFEKEGT